MKISVIVAVYNASSTINKVIESVLSQTYDNYELILVDDESTDNSYEIIKDWENKNSKIKAYTKKNTGPGYTRKFGFEKSTGDLLFFVDSDDWVTDNKVFAKINELFYKYNMDVLFFDREDILGNDKSILKAFRKVKRGLHNIDNIREFIRPGLGCKIFKKEKFSSNMFVESVVYEDLYPTYMYLDLCKNFYYIDEPFYSIYHDIDSDSLSSYKRYNRYEIDKKSLEIIYEVYNFIHNESLKYCLELVAANMFLSFIMKYKKRDNSDINKIMVDFAKILKQNKIPYLNDYNLKFNNLLKFYIKKCYYKLSLNKFLKENCK